MLALYSSHYPLPSTYRVFELLATRRSLKPEAMKHEPLDPQVLRACLDAAQWAPTHGMTEPWRFIHFASRPAQVELGGILQKTYLTACRESGKPPKEAKVAKFATRVHCGGALLGVFADCGRNPSIPPADEWFATACAVQNVALAATHFGLGLFWGTGPYAHHPSIGAALELPEAARFMGLLFLGYPAGEWPVGQRSGMEGRISVR